MSLIPNGDNIATIPAIARRGSAIRYPATSLFPEHIAVQPEALSEAGSKYGQMGRDGSGCCL
jgi:hypothetical protein